MNRFLRIVGTISALLALAILGITVASAQAPLRIGIITFTHCELPPFAVDWLQKNDARLKELANSYRI